MGGVFFLEIGVLSPQVQLSKSELLHVLQGAL